MKTLREYIDQLDEIDRRGFLKGMGAAAIAGGAGYVGGVRRVQNTTLARVLGKLNGFLKPLKASKVKDKWSYENITRTRDLIEKYKIDPDIFNYSEYSFGENQGERAFSMAFQNGIQTDQDREKYEAMLFELSADLMNATSFHSKYSESVEEGIKSKLAGAALAGALAMNPAQAQEVPNQPIQITNQAEMAKTAAKCSAYYFLAWELTGNKNEKLYNKGAKLEQIANSQLGEKNTDKIFNSITSNKKYAEMMSDPTQLRTIIYSCNKWYEKITQLSDIQSQSDTQLASWKDQIRTAMMREQDLEEASPDAVKRIEQLVRYK